MGPAALRSVEHAGESVCTVFFGDEAIGGLLLAEGDCWLWAIFAPAPPLGGAAATKAQAYAALEGRWNAWAEASGLTPRRGTRPH